MSEYKDYNWTTDNSPMSMAYIMPKLMPLLPQDGSFILDVGCGNGALVNYLIKQGYNAYGIDASKTGIEIAKKTNPDHFFVQNLADKKLPEELQKIKFNAIISTEVIEHLYDPRNYIQFCKDLLLASGGGQLIITTPYHGFLKNLALSLFNAWDKHFTVLWDGGHIKFWSFRTISQLLREKGLEVTDFKGCGRLPYLWKSMLVVASI